MPASTTTGGEWIHYGLTSSDVLDTAAGVIMRQAADVLVARLDDLIEVVLTRAEEHRRLNVKDLRESLGLSRHLSLPLVEFFDQVGFTKRDPEGRRVRRDATEMFGGASNA